jgi:hypothetical protein
MAHPIPTPEPGLIKKGFLFLGVPFLIWSDSEKVLKEFETIYRRFRCPEGYPGPAEKREALSFFLLTDTPDKRPILKTGNESFFLEAGDLPAAIYFFVLNSLFQMVGSHFLVHGGVVEKNGKGIIIAGPSSAGKTTLIVELARRGYAFLSDELAPIDRATGLIKPFPRLIGIRRDQGEFKKLLDIESLPGGRLGRACPPGWFFLLSPAAKPLETQETRFIEIAFNKVDQTLLEALGRMGEVLSIERLSRRPYPSLRLSVLKGPLVEKIDHLCQSLGVYIIQYYDGFSESPDFSLSPRIEALPGMAGVLEAARHLLNGKPPSRLCRDFDNSRTAMIMELAGLLGGASFYRLTPGRLNEMVRLIEEETG